MSKVKQNSHNSNIISELNLIRIKAFIKEQYEFNLINLLGYQMLGNFLCKFFKRLIFNYNIGLTSFC
jgi:hypothetical protein